jgi:hypothetical protein
MTSVDQVIAFLREFGFPTFVCLWFMWRMEKKIESFLDTQAKIMVAITVLTQVFDIDLDERPSLESPKKPEDLP